MHEYEILLFLKTILRNQSMTATASRQPFYYRGKLRLKKCKYELMDM